MALVEPDAEDCDCCCVDEGRPKDSGFEGGGPAGVVDVFGKAKLDVGLLVGVEVPKLEAVDVLPAALPNRPPPPAVAVANGFAVWVVAGDFGCEFCPKPKPAEVFWFPAPKVLVPLAFPPPPPPPNKPLP